MTQNVMLAMNAIRLALAFGLLTAPLTASAEDASVKQRLDQIGMKYEIDKDGDYKVTIDFAKERRTQMVFVSGTTEAVSGFTIRKIFSPAAIVATDAFFSGQGQRLAGLSIRHRIPTISTYREHVIAGTLMSYGQNIAAFHALAATYVDRILKGAKPADLPMEQPTRMELLIRRSAAKSLKLAVPQELLLRANEVIE